MNRIFTPWEFSFESLVTFPTIAIALVLGNFSMNVFATDATVITPNASTVAVDTNVGLIMWTGYTNQPVVTSLNSSAATSLNTGGVSNTEVGNSVGATTINGSGVDINTTGATTVGGTLAVSGAATAASLNTGAGAIQTTGAVQAGTITTTGAANLNSVSIANNAVIGSAANSSVTVGNQNGSGVGTTTVSFNNNRLQNVATATAASDAVNLGQVNQLIANAGGASPALQNQVNGIQNQVNNLQSQVNQNNLIAQRGIAGAGAIAGIPAIEPGKNFSVGVGVGNYVSASAISVGAQARLTQSTVFKVAAGTTTFGGVVTSAGLGVSF